MLNPLNIKAEASAEIKAFDVGTNLQSNGTRVKVEKETDEHG
jgi:hypothetical protein